MKITDYPATKKKVFLAASKLFFEKCYADVGIREIAAEAGVKVPTVYNHYPSKEAILEDLFQVYNEQLTELYDATRNVDYNQDPMECFRQMIPVFKDDEIGLMRQLMRIVFTEQHRSALAAKIVYDISLRRGKMKYLDYLTYLKNKGIIQCEGIDSFAEIFSRIGITFAMQFTRDDEILRRPDFETVLMDMFELILNFQPAEEREEELVQVC
jgi:AcrR family transcriptional regulator